MCIFKNSPQVKIIYLGDTDMIIPCQTAFVRNEANRICVIVWAVIVDINICREMKSPSCVNIIQAGQVWCVFSMLSWSLKSAYRTTGRLWPGLCWTIHDCVVCGIRASAWSDSTGERERGTDGDGNCLPTTLTIPPVRSQPGICVSLYWCCSKSTVALFLSEYIWSAIVSPVNRPAVLSSVSAINSFLLLRGRDTHRSCGTAA